MTSIFATGSAGKFFGLGAGGDEAVPRRWKRRETVPRMRRVNTSYGE